MGKFVILKFGDGSFERGFPVTLQICVDGEVPSVEIVGALPEAKHLPIYYDHWQASYRRLANAFRLSADKVQVTNVSVTEDCQATARTLHSHFNLWLQSESFRPLREKWLERLGADENIRVILQTEHNQIQRLPWQGWDLLERYPKAEIAIASPSYERSDKLRTYNSKVKILAILGNSKGINTQADQALLNNLPDADVTFLVEPQRQQLNDHLWESHWDILFFAGHSSSHNNESGLIYLNQNDSLSMKELRYALLKAVDRGLYLAIFNSCDGLGLARELNDLQIPEIVFMREPVPDRVASEFLKYFLAEFSNGETFFQSVRHSRERLQGLEDKFPCATWLPMICQHNPAQIPLTWNQLRRINEPSANITIPHPPQQPEAVLLSANPEIQPQPKILTSLIKGIVIALIICGLRLFGLFESIELKSFDQMMWLRLLLVSEPPDNRLLIVTIDDDDLAEQRRKQEQLKGTSLSDKSLNLLLDKLQQHQPRAIGLDIYRDFKAEDQQLIQRLQQTKNLVAICKGSDATVSSSGIAPPPEIPNQIAQERLGFSDFLIDSDGIIRRHLLYMRQEPNSLCAAPYSLSLQLAFHYLQFENIPSPQATPEKLTIGKAVFPNLNSRTGAYQNIDANGAQILLNWRANQKIAPKVKLSEVLTGQINPEAFKDKIVLIGVTAKGDLQDYRPTPYSSNPDSQMSGVQIHAHMLSQILSAVLDNRPLLQVWSPLMETIWILSWSLVGSILAWRLHNHRSPFVISIITTTGMLYIIGFGMVISGYWIPFIPCVITFVGSAASYGFRSQG